MKTKVKCSNWIKPVRAIGFLLVLCMALSAVSRLVTSPDDYREYQWVHGFYKEPKNSIDVVFIGSSVNYSEVNPMVIWNTSGIAAWNYTTNSQPFEAVEYVLREGLKRQPNALYVINLNTIHSALTKADLHWLTDYMPPSQNRTELIDRILELRQDRLDQLMEAEEYEKVAKETEGDDENLRWHFIVPPLLYHSRWSELNSRDYTYALDGVKGAPYYYEYLYKQTNISDLWISNSELKKLPERTEEALERLLTLIEEDNVNVLFTIYARAEGSQLLWSRYNTLEKRLTDLGYPVLDIRAVMDEIGLNPGADYYNRKHTNIHGAIKISTYIATYIQEHYGFIDRRDDPKYASWNRGAEKYFTAVSPYMLDLELDVAHRDYNLAAPTIEPLIYKDGTVTLKWAGIEGADGYLIYRREKNPDARKDDFIGKALKPEYDLSKWTQVAETDLDSCIYLDHDVEAQHEYSYTVVPYYTQNGETYYGRFYYTGKSIVI